MAPSAPGIEPGGSLVVSLALLLWLLLKGSRAFVAFFDRHTTDHVQEDTPMPATPSRPRPLRTIGSIAGGLTALVTGLVGSGLLNVDQGGAITGVIAAVVTLLGTLGLVVAAERHVTPLRDPRDAQGHPLVSAPDDLG